jgi:outer membrane receptor protein involved in Fe transport
VDSPDSLAAFRVSQLGVYLQDQWSVAPRLTLTGGIRLEVPFVPTPPGKNPTALTTLAINTSLTPSGHPLWSPRLGVNWDASGRGTTALRGGIGFFAGRPAFQWFRNVYRTNGALGHRIICLEGTVPAFTLDPGNQPSACAVPTPSPASLAFNYFDPEFRFPQNLKVALGIDHLLAGGVVGTIDLLYSGGVHTFHVADANLRGPQTIAAGEGGRVLYGTINPETGAGDPTRRSEDVGSAFEIRNGSGDRSWSLTSQLQHQRPDGTEWSAAYTYTDARDRMSPDADLAITNASSTPVDGSLESRAVRTSLWETTHKLTLLATANLPLGLRLGVVYTAISGSPFTYVLDGDPNADGFGSGAGNDVVYVPRDSADITLENPSAYSELDSLIRSQTCLRQQRGRLLRRNSCHNPALHDVQLRLARRFTLAPGRELEITADLFNVLNLVDSEWGLPTQTLVGGEGHVVPLLELTGYDEDRGRGRYRLVPVYRQVDEGARWRLQLGGALSFH